MTKSIVNRSGFPDKDISLPEHDDIVLALLDPAVFTRTFRRWIDYQFQSVLNYQDPWVDTRAKYHAQILACVKKLRGWKDVFLLSIDQEKQLDRDREDLRRRWKEWKSVGTCDGKRWMVPGVLPSGIEPMLSSELPLKKGNGWIIGYADIFCRGVRFRVDDCARPRRAYGNLLVEVKGRRVNFGETLRQVRSYMEAEYVACEVSYAVVAPPGCIPEQMASAFRAHNITAVEFGEG